MQLSPELFMVDESTLENDYTYMKQLEPEVAKSLLDLIEDVCDRLEYEGSFMYDEYPDKTTLLKMTDTITERASESGVFSRDTSISLKDFIQTLLCDEILHRRSRYHRKRKMFNNPF